MKNQEWPSGVETYSYFSIDLLFYSVGVIVLILFFMYKRMKK